MRFDPCQRLLTASVRELVVTALTRQRPATSTPWRARLGQQAHLRYQALRAAEVEVVDRELPLSCERTVAGHQASVRGRADLLVRDPDGALAVEEVKSSSLEGDADVQGPEVEAAFMQACIYALCLEERLRGEGRDELVRARVALIDVSDDRYQLLEVDYRQGATASRLDDAIAQLLTVALAAEERRALRAQLASRLVFPHVQPRPHQLELSALVREGLEARRPVLMSAPTGIGKTIAALLPALRFAMQTGAQVLYVTAKTTQRSHVASAFVQLVEASSLDEDRPRAVTLRRKEEMCPPGHLVCQPHACPWLVDLEVRLEEAGVLESLRQRVHVEPEQIVDLCAPEQLCPYYSARLLAAEADLVVGDFNHLLGAGGGEPERQVVVIDEAHNLFDRAREQLSPFVGERDLTRLRRWLSSLERGVGPLPDRLDVRQLCKQVEVAIDAEVGAQEHAGGEEQGGDDDGGEAQGPCLIDGCAARDLDPRRWQQLAGAAATLALRWTTWRQRLEDWPSDGEGLDPLLELADRLARLADLLSPAERELIAFVATHAAPRGKGVGVVCVDPSRRLEAHHRRAAGVVAMSATLTPLPYFSEVLGLSRLDPLLTSAPSPFPAENRRVLVVPTLSTTLREREASAPALARLLEQVVAVRPGCYAAFFPSFAYLSRVRSLLTLPPSQVMVQAPGMATSARQSVLSRLRAADRPLLLLAVMGGVFGEGVDLPGEALVGAIVVGPGMPSVSFERALMRNHFEERYEAGFAYAMVYPGLQRVIQAAGRVIRGDSDRGVILLVGRRFAEGELSRCLPPEWYRHDPAELRCDDPIGDLEGFWNGTPQPAGASATWSRGPAGPMFVDDT